MIFYSFLKYSNLLKILLNITFINTNTVKVATKINVVYKTYCNSFDENFLLLYENRADLFFSTFEKNVENFVDQSQYNIEMALFEKVGSVKEQTLDTFKKYYGVVAFSHFPDMLPKTYSYIVRFEKKTFYGLTGPLPTFFCLVSLYFICSFQDDKKIIKKNIIPFFQFKEVDSSLSTTSEFNNKTPEQLEFIKETLSMRLDSTQTAVKQNNIFMNAYTDVTQKILFKSVSNDFLEIEIKKKKKMKKKFRDFNFFKKSNIDFADQFNFENLNIQQKYQYLFPIQSFYPDLKEITQIENFSTKDKFLENSSQKNRIAVTFQQLNQIVNELQKEKEERLARHNEFEKIKVQEKKKSEDEIINNFSEKEKQKIEKLKKKIQNDEEKLIKKNFLLNENLNKEIILEEKLENVSYFVKKKMIPMGTNDMITFFKSNPNFTSFLRNLNFSLFQYFQGDKIIPFEEISQFFPEKNENFSQVSSIKLNDFKQNCKKLENSIFDLNLKKYETERLLNVIDFIIFMDVVNQEHKIPKSELDSWLDCLYKGYTILDLKSYEDFDSTKFPENLLLSRFLMEFDKDIVLLSNVFDPLQKVYFIEIVDKKNLSVEDKDDIIQDFEYLRYQLFKIKQLRKNTFKKMQKKRKSKFQSKKNFSDEFQKETIQIHLNALREFENIITYPWNLEKMDETFNILQDQIKNEIQTFEDIQLYFETNVPFHEILNEMYKNIEHYTIRFPEKVPNKIHLALNPLSETFNTENFDKKIMPENFSKFGLTKNLSLHQISKFDLSNQTDWSIYDIYFSDLDSVYEIANETGENLRFEHTFFYNFFIDFFCNELLLLLEKMKEKPLTKEILTKILIKELKKETINKTDLNLKRKDIVLQKEFITRKKVLQKIQNDLIEKSSCYSTKSHLILKFFTSPFTILTEEQLRNWIQKWYRIEINPNRVLKKYFPETIDRSNFHYFTTIDSNLNYILEPKKILSLSEIELSSRHNSLKETFKPKGGQNTVASISNGGKVSISYSWTEERTFTRLYFPRLMILVIFLIGYGRNFQKFGFIVLGLKRFCFRQSRTIFREAKKPLRVKLMSPFQRFPHFKDFSISGLSPIDLYGEFLSIRKLAMSRFFIRFSIIVLLNSFYAIYSGMSPLFYTMALFFVFSFSGKRAGLIPYLKPISQILQKFFKSGKLDVEYFNLRGVDRNHWNYQTQSSYILAGEQSTGKTTFIKALLHEFATVGVVTRIRKKLDVELAFSFGSVWRPSFVIFEKLDWLGGSKELFQQNDIESAVTPTEYDSFFEIDLNIDTRLWHPFKIQPSVFLHENIKNNGKYRNNFQNFIKKVPKKLDTKKFCFDKYYNCLEKIDSLNWTFVSEIYENFFCLSNTFDSVKNIRLNFLSLKNIVITKKTLPFFSKSFDENSFLTRFHFSKKNNFSYIPGASYPTYSIRITTKSKYRSRGFRKLSEITINTTMEKGIYFDRNSDHKISLQFNKEQLLWTAEQRNKREHVDGFTRRPQISEISNLSLNQIEKINENSIRSFEKTDIKKKKNSVSLRVASEKKKDPNHFYRQTLRSIIDSGYQKIYLREPQMDQFILDETFTVVFSHVFKIRDTLSTFFDNDELCLSKYNQIEKAELFRKIKMKESEKEKKAIQKFFRTKFLMLQLLIYLEGTFTGVIWSGTIILGLVNNYNNLDPKLRRIGRFDRCICFKIPNRIGRVKLLKLHSFQHPFTPPQSEMPWDLLGCISDKLRCNDISLVVSQAIFLSTSKLILNRDTVKAEVRKEIERIKLGFSEDQIMFLPLLFPIFVKVIRNRLNLLRVTRADDFSQGNTPCLIFFSPYVIDALEKDVIREANVHLEGKGFN